MKNKFSSLKDKVISSNLEKYQIQEKRSTNINILLNRVKIKQKSETRKKLYFSAAASTGLLLFGFLIF
tara:strand:- start:137 stop:340 length:204 start_codon:yes stop_codon:yes gene_type:complete